jgi:threonine dehydrogenase-like Zn-dependent dehydrogenase
MPDTATALWIVEPGRAQLRDVTLPALSCGDFEVRTLYSGVSRGSEALIFQGAVPVSEHQRMRAPFQEGEFPGPVKYGYISVGLIEAGPEEAVGQPVFCLYPHQTRYRVPGDAVYAIPNDVPLERAVLAAQMETAVNGLWDAGPLLGERISVVGAGVLGCLCAWLASRVPGCDVELIDTNPRRASTATALGVGFSLPGDARLDADLVFHTSGAAGGLSTALRLAAFEARIIELSWFGASPVSAPLGEAFHQRRLTLRSSQVGSIPLQQRARWDHRRRMQLALSLLADPVLDALITGEDSFREMPRVLEKLVTAPGDALMHRICYQ